MRQRCNLPATTRLTRDYVWRLYLGDRPARLDPRRVSAWPDTPSASTPRCATGGMKHPECAFAAARFRIFNWEREREREQEPEQAREHLKPVRM